MDPHQIHYFSSRLDSEISPAAVSDEIIKETARKNSKDEEEEGLPHDYSLAQELSGPRSQFGSSMDNTWLWKLELKANTFDIWEVGKSSKADEEVRSPHDHYILPEELSGPRPEFVSSMNNTWPWKLELKNNEFVTVKATQPLGNFGGEEVKKIPKEEAICRFCFDVYQANMLKTNCRCKFCLAHESCANEWLHKKGNNKCDVCEQDIQIVRVTVSSDHISSTSGTRNKELQRGSTRKRSWSSYCCFGL